MTNGTSSVGSLAVAIPPKALPPTQLFHPVPQEPNPGVSLVGDVAPGLEIIASRWQIDGGILGPDIHFILIDFCVHAAPARILPWVI